jgi:curved DNA-binding protein CbpA
MTKEDQDSSIDEILDAPDYYAVLGVPKTADTGTLRRAYLSKSVQVHPDKNNDPRATEAFQRIAEAWNVLSDETTRAEYDERAKGNDNESYYMPPPAPSFQDALFAFATATSMMGGGSSSGVGSMAQTIYWAEKLVQGRPETITTEKTAHAAMALGSGLRAVAFGARMMGFKNASVVADRSATLAQTVGVGALVTNAAKDNPAVQQALAQGGEKAKEISGSINRSIKRAVGANLCKTGSGERRTAEEKYCRQTGKD